MRGLALAAVCGVLAFGCSTAETDATNAGADTGPEQSGCEPACESGAECVATTCVDVDECVAGAHDCGANATCTNTEGGFECACDAGYQGDGRTCTQSVCEPNPCQNDGQCFEASGVALCECAEGFEGDHCEIDVDECAGDPCLNGGTCTDGVSGFTCECAPGWAGEDCSVETDECDPNPCQNGGTCVDEASGFSCACALGWGGDTCTEAIDNCTPDPCKNGGTCVGGTGGVSCDCPDGFEGNTCTVNVDECAPNPCQNGGTCTDGVPSFTCACAAGWGGDDCTANVDECDPNPCQNGGTCTDGLNDFTCACATGWEGDTCTASVDDCAGNPCQNGGTCVDDVNAFTCECADGWEGDTCATEVDECDPNPCQNGGTCADGLDGFTCSCVGGWEGKSCTDNVDECDPNPCLNGGTCTDGLDGFTCTCAGGWEGDTCAGNVDDCTPNPCQNGGTCTDGLSSFTCACAGGWEGDTCTVNVDDCTPNPCQNGGTCADGVGGFTCECTNGHTGGDCTACEGGYQDHDEDGACLPTCETAGIVCFDGTCSDASGTPECDCGGVACQPAVFVDAGADPGGDGKTWETAFDALADAIDANTGDRPIWVKAGTFGPAAANESVLVMAEGMAFYGGFDPALTGTDGDPDARTPGARTTLDGDFDGNPTNASVHVVVGSSTARLDGFVITGGYADGEGADARGAGLAVDLHANLTIASTTISGNVAAASSGDAVGGGLACQDTMGLVLEDVIIEDNVALGGAAPGLGSGAGGGVWLSDCETSLTGVTIAGNRAEGGAVAEGSLSPGADAFGGGLYLAGSTLTVIGLTVMDNIAQGGAGDDGDAGEAGTHGGYGAGGGIYLDGVATGWEAVTLSGNSALGGDGGDGGAAGDTVAGLVPTCPSGAGGGDGGPGYGGGLAVVADATVEILSGEIAGNTALGGAGGAGGAAGDCEGSEPGAAGESGESSGGAVYGEGLTLVHGFTAGDVSENQPDGIAPCPAGYEGDLCEQEIDECDPNPCQNGGSCSDLVADFSCGCASGWQGNTCQLVDCAAVACDDGDSCTFDYCTPAEGCQNRALTCDDGDECTNDSCGQSDAVCAFGELSDGSCYHAVASAGTWAEAEGACEDLGGTLAVITSASENSTVRAMADANAACAGQDIWIGFNDLAQEGAFAWPTGETGTYTGWGDSEPNDAGDEDVTELKADGTWSDRMATTAGSCYVCELAPVGGSVCLNAPKCTDGDPCTVDTCEAGTCSSAPYEVMGRFGSYLLCPGTGTWAEAETSCAAQGMALASVIDVTEDDLLADAAATAGMASWWLESTAGYGAWCDGEPGDAGACQVAGTCDGWAAADCGGTASWICELSCPSGYAGSDCGTCVGGPGLADLDADGVVDLCAPEPAEECAGHCFTASTFENNSSGAGGGIRLDDDADSTTVTVRRSAFIDNYGGQGGGIRLGTTSTLAMLVENTTFAGGDATTGGGMYSELKGSADITFDSVTMTANHPSKTGPAIRTLYSGGTITLRNCLFAGNKAGEDPLSGATGVLVSAGGNVITTAPDGFATDTDLVSTHDDPIDPMLSDLVDDGVNPPYYVPLAGSPALDAGVAGGPVEDQRGLTRPLDADTDGDAAPDAGAVEYACDGDDTDGDGLPDACDACPLTARNDGDGDGVCDDADTCLLGDDGDDADLDGTPDACDLCADGGETDSDGDLTPDDCDCAPDDPERHGAASEICNLADDDCNGEVDEGLTCFVVDSTDDLADSNEGDGTCADSQGNCTLRAALQEVRQLGSGEIWVLAGEYLLAGSETARGVTVRGEGAASTVITGDGSDTLFVIFGGDAWFEGLTVRGGNSTGGGCFLGIRALTLVEVIVEDCSAGVGGAIGANDDLTLVDSTVRGNTSDSAGVISVYGEHGPSEITITRSTISGNIVAGDGVLHLLGGPQADVTLTVTASTISGNTAASDGIVVLKDEGATSLHATFTASTIVENAVTGGGSVPAVAASGIGSVTLQNTVLSNPGCTAEVTGEDLTSLGGNIVRDGSDLGHWIATDRVGSAASPLDVGLGTLAANGGPTQTHRPNDDSICIDAGMTTTVLADQRGYVIPLDGDGDGAAAPDAGSVERLAP